MRKFKWTIIMQISGENNLLPDNIRIFNEFAKHGSNNEVCFIILLDQIRVRGDLGPKFHYLTGESNDFPGLFKARKGVKLVDATADKRFRELDDLSSKENLTEVLQYVKDNFEADNYGYIYNGHGGAGQTDVSNASFVSEVVTVRSNEYNNDGTVNIPVVTERLERESVWTTDGWVLDYVFFLDEDNQVPEILLVIFSRVMTEDDEEGELKTLTYRAMSQVLQDVFGKKELKFVMLDCCWGMMLENVSIFKDATRLLIASPDEMPALGIGYQNLCEAILERPQIKPEELGKMMVAVFYAERYADYEDPDDPDNTVFAKMGVSLTCADTLEFENKIFPKLEEFCGVLETVMPSFRDNLRLALDACKDYTYANPQVYDMYNIDLVWLLENIIFQNPNPSTPNLRKINDLALELIRDLKVYLMSGFLANNYQKASLGVEAIGGKGISITFPRRIVDYDDSELAEEFFPIDVWKSMIKKFYNIISIARLRDRMEDLNLTDAQRLDLKPEELFEITPLKPSWRLIFSSGRNELRNFDR